jgi:small-conductance mechanosensitive channel
MPHAPVLSRALPLLAQTTGAANTHAPSHVEMEKLGPVEVSHTTYLLLSHAGVIVATLLAALILLRLVPLLERLVIRWASAHEGQAATASMIDRRQRVETLTRVTSSVAQVVIWTSTLIAIAGDVGVAVGPLIAGAGIAGVAVGFGAQSIVKDFFSGFFILLENQFDVGDTITVGGVTGIVERMTMRITVLRDSAGTAHFFPNSNISNVANKTHGWTRAMVDAVFAPSVPLAAASATLDAAAAHATKELDAQGALLEPIRVEGPLEFTPSGVTWRLVGKAVPGASAEVKRAMIAALSTELASRGFAADGGALSVKAA